MGCMSAKPLVGGYRVGSVIISKIDYEDSAGTIKRGDFGVLLGPCSQATLPDAAKRMNGDFPGRKNVDLRLDQIQLAVDGEYDAFSTKAGPSAVEFTIVATQVGKFVEFRFERSADGRVGDWYVCDEYMLTGNRMARYPKNVSNELGQKDAQDIMLLIDRAMETTIQPNGDIVQVNKAGSDAALLSEWKSFAQSMGVPFLCDMTLRKRSVSAPAAEASEDVYEENAA